MYIPTRSVNASGSYKFDIFIYWYIESIIENNYAYRSQQESYPIFVSFNSNSKKLTTKNVIIT